MTGFILMALVCLTGPVAGAVWAQSRAYDQKLDPQTRFQTEASDQERPRVPGTSRVPPGTPSIQGQDDDYSVSVATIPLNQESSVEQSTGTGKPFVPPVSPSGEPAQNLPLVAGKPDRQDPMPGLDAIREAADGREDYSYPNRREFKKMTEGRLRDYDNRIDYLDDYTRKSPDADRTRRENALAGMRGKSMDIQYRLSQIDTVAPDRWSAAKAGVEYDMLTLDQALSALELEMRIEPRQKRYQEDERRQQGRSG